MADETKKKKGGCLKTVIIVVVVLAVLGALFGGGDDKEPTNTADTTQSQTTQSETQPEENGSVAVREDADQPESDWIGAGTYKVGSDIPAGEYYIRVTGLSCYYQVAADSSGTLDSIITNGNISSNAYQTVVDGQYLQVSDGEFTLASNMQGMTKLERYPDGMYKVGVDIDAGEYKITAGTSGCYFAVLSSSNGTLDDIISNQNLDAGVGDYITVTDGQYLEIRGGTAELA